VLHGHKNFLRPVMFAVLSIPLWRRAFLASYW